MFEDLIAEPEQNLPMDADKHTVCGFCESYVPSNPSIGTCKKTNIMIGFVKWSCNEYEEIK